MKINFFSRLSPISPVISSILSCTDCRTSNLTENVTILFDLPPRMMNSIRTCVFADLRYFERVILFASVETIIDLIIIYCSIEAI